MYTMANSLFYIKQLIHYELYINEKNMLDLIRLNISYILTNAYNKN